MQKNEAYTIVFKCSKWILCYSVSQDKGCAVPELPGESSRNSLEGEGDREDCGEKFVCFQWRGWDRKESKHRRIGQWRGRGGARPFLSDILEPYLRLWCMYITDFFFF